MTRFPNSLVRWGLVLLAVLSAASAGAQDVVFPPGGRIGLAPPAGFALSDRFSGFVDAEGNASILIIEAPAPLFAQISGASNEQMASKGITVAARRPLPVDGAPGVLITGRQKAQGRDFAKWMLFVGYDDLSALVTVQVEGQVPAEKVRQIESALATTVRRPALSLDEKLAALPFRLTTLGGLRIANVMANTAAVLTRGPNDTVKGAEQPLLVVGGSISAPPTHQSLEALSRQALLGVSSIEIAEIEQSDAGRQDGDETMELIARGRTRSTGEPIVIWQWMRLMGGGYLRLVGISALADRDKDLAVYREVRDGVRWK